MSVGEGLGDAGTAFYHRLEDESVYGIKYYDSSVKDYSGGSASQTPDVWEKHSVAYNESSGYMAAWLDYVYLGTGSSWNDVSAIDTFSVSSRNTAESGSGGYFNCIGYQTRSDPECGPFS